MEIGSAPLCQLKKMEEKIKFGIGSRGAKRFDEFGSPVQARAVH
jgi:hypothetical protein